MIGRALGVPAILLFASTVAAQDQRTGTLVPGGDSSSMVEAAGRISTSERVRSGKGAAARRAANEVHQTMRGYAACLVTGVDTNRERMAVVAYLKAMPGTPEAISLGRRVSKPSCLYDAPADAILLRYDGETLRGQLFRQLYLDRDRTPPRTAAMRQALGAVAIPASGGSFVGTQRFADCIVGKNPEAADALMRVEVGSPEQDVAVRNVAPLMAGCLQQKLTLQMSRIVLEGALAEALYRRATTSGGAAMVVPGTAAAAPAALGQN